MADDRHALLLMSPGNARLGLRLSQALEQSYVTGEDRGMRVARDLLRS